MRYFLLLLCFFFNYNSASAQWLSATNRSAFGDIIVTNQNRIIATQTSTHVEPGGTTYSDNGGKTWFPLKENPNGQQLQLRLLGKQGNRLYGTSNNGIWTSTNNGNSWQLNPFPTALYYYQFKASEKCAVFVTNEYDGLLLVSLDEGKSWQELQVPADYVTGIDVRSDIIYVTCRYDGAFKATYLNNKWIWEKISYSGEPNGIALINADSYIITTLISGGFIISPQKKEQITLKNSEGKNEWNLEDVFILGNYWVITTNKQSGKIFVSTDQGKNWKDFSGGLPKPFNTGNAIREVPLSKAFILMDTLYTLVGEELMKRPLNELTENYLETATDLKVDISKRNTHIINWTDNSATEKGFIIERSENNLNNFKEVGRVAENTGGFTDYDVPGGKRYYYRIKSYNAITSSRYSDILVVDREPNVCKLAQKLIYSSFPSSVRFINEKTGFWIKGGGDDSAYLLRTDDGGVSWKEVPLHTHIGFYTSLEFLDEKTGFINILSPIDEYWGLMTIDGGMTWRKVNNTHKVYREKSAILFKTKPAEKFFINDSTSFTNYNGYFSRLENYGENQTTIKIDSTENPYITVNKIFFTDSKNGFTFYYGNIIRTSDGGNNWAEITIPYVFNQFVDMYTPDKKTIYFIGNEGDQSKPGILKTSDNGKTFELIKIKLNSSAGVQSISFLGNKAWLVSTTGELYVSEDNLKSWQILNDEINFYRGAVSFKNKWGLFGADYNAGNKDKYMAYMTYDGGRTWKDIKLPSKQGEWYQYAPKVKVFNDNKAIVFTAAVLYETSDRGKTWNTIEQPFTMQSDGFLYNFYPVSEKLWFLSHRFGNEDYKLYRTDDGGRTWKHIPEVINPLEGFYFFNEQIGFVKGNGTGWYRTINGGTSWTNLNIGNDNFFDGSGIGLADSKNGFFVGGGATDNRYVSKIFRTKDTGATWEEINLPESVKEKSGLERIKFMNDKVGYVTGRDFMIKTTDGGLTWTETTSDRFFNEYAHLVNLDESYSFSADTYNTRLYHLEPANAAVKPHEPNGNIDGCLFVNAPNVYEIDNNDSYSYQWKISGGGTLVTDRNQAKVKWNQLGTFMVSVKAVNDCGESDWQETPVTVHNLAETPTLVSGELIACPKVNLTYQLKALDNYTYEWFIPSGIPAKLRKNIAVINWPKESEVYTVKALANDEFCPSDTFSFRVVTKTLPLVPGISKELSGNFLLTSTSVNDNQWFFENKPIEGATQRTYIPSEGTGWYSVQVSNECGAAMSEKTYVVILSAEEERDNDIVSYPNPATNEITIRRGQSPIDTIYLYDTNGRVLKQAKEQINGEYKISVTDLSSGAYILKIISNNHVISRKVVIHR